jgi:hypothetical protein
MNENAILAPKAIKKTASTFIETGFIYYYFFFSKTFSVSYALSSFKRDLMLVNLIVIGLPAYKTNVLYVYCIF